MQNKQILIAETAWPRIAKWCALQERSQFETRRKLRSIGISEADAEQLIAKLIAENYLNESRFAAAFAGGKFRTKGWGREKIAAALKLHRVSPRNITEALASLDNDTYRKSMRALAEKKLRAIGGNDRRSRYHKAFAYLVGRGFEPTAVQEELNQQLGEPDDEFRT